MRSLLVGIEAVGVVCCHWLRRRAAWRWHAVLAGLMATLAFNGVCKAGTIAQAWQVLPDTPAAGDVFGGAVALADGLALVGASGDDERGDAAGAAYLFDLTNRQQTLKLTASDAAALDEFGVSVALANGVAAVGSGLHDAAGGSRADAGAVYLFDTANGQQTAKLTASDAAAGDRFGWSVALTGGRVLVGSYLNDAAATDSGAAYLFDASDGSQLTKLVPTDAASGDFFGRSVALSDAHALVGNYRDDDNGPDSGSAYLYDAQTGQFLLKLKPDDGAFSDQFGYAVAVHGDRALVGSPLAAHNGKRSGTAYLFDVNTGDPVAKLAPADGATFDQFGFSVALFGDLALVGSSLDDDLGSSSGSAYLYHADTGAFIAKLTAGDGTGGDSFGTAVALWGQRALIGTVGSDIGGNNSGAAYLFRVPTPASLTTLLIALVGLSRRRRAKRQA